MNVVIVEKQCESLEGHLLVYTLCRCSVNTGLYITYTLVV